jgi:hypothetical protein
MEIGSSSLAWYLSSKLHGVTSQKIIVLKHGSLISTIRITFDVPPAATVEAAKHAQWAARTGPLARLRLSFRFFTPPSSAFISKFHVLRVFDIGMPPPHKDSHLTHSGSNIHIKTNRADQKNLRWQHLQPLLHNWLTVQFASRHRAGIGHR